MRCARIDFALVAPGAAPLAWYPMKIYTKTGDDGQTGILGGVRLSKASARIEAYGTVDELNACLGVIGSLKAPREVLETLVRVQEQLFVVGTELASLKRSDKLPVLAPEQVTDLEKAIDAMEAHLPPLQNFILPGGSAAGAHLHMARTVCRRAERRLIGFYELEPSARNPLLIHYLNRLSDYLFVAARFTNAHSKTPEIPWRAT